MYEINKIHAYYDERQKYKQGLLYINSKPFST